MTQSLQSGACTKRIKQSTLPRNANRIRKREPFESRICDVPLYRYELIGETSPYAKCLIELFNMCGIVGLSSGAVFVIVKLNSLYNNPFWVVTLGYPS